KAMELFCGAGGLSEGAKPFVHTVLASDINERACKLFASNHRGTTVMPANINDRSAQLHIIAEARRLGVEVSSGGPPCTDFSMSGKRCSQKGIQCIISMLQVSAAVSTVRMVLLENVVGFLSTPEFQQTLDLAQGLGFDHSHNVISVNDCGLPTKRRRVFIM
ncbi:S-adenosyl-L-methionine-dependent methyltransferase, partial [Tribonema minus]